MEHFNINKKDIDLFVYYRKHENKNIDDLKIILKKIITNNNINVHICGNHLNILGVINHGVLNKKQIIKLLKKTKFALSTADNLLSYFVLDAINCGAKILYLSKKSYNLKINGLFIFAQGDCKYIFSSKIHSKNYNIFQKKKIISFQRSFLKSAQYKK